MKLGKVVRPFYKVIPTPTNNLHLTVAQLYPTQVLGEPTLSVMEDNQQFAKSLMARRNHYQSLCENYERSRAHAKEQIKSNANALLFESIVEEQELVLTLISLRHQWQERTPGVRAPNKSCLIADKSHQCVAGG